jgi:hypothetical protein
MSTTSLVDGILRGKFMASSSNRQSGGGTNNSSSPKKSSSVQSRATGLASAALSCKHYRPNREEHVINIASPH